MIRSIIFSICITAFSFTLFDLAFAQDQNDEPEWHPDLTSDWTPVVDSVYTTAPGKAPSDAIIFLMAVPVGMDGRI